MQTSNKVKYKINLLSFLIFLAFAFISATQVNASSIKKVPRFGVGVHSHSPGDKIEWYDWQQMGFSWFFTWGSGPANPANGYPELTVPEGLQFYPMFYSGGCSSRSENFIREHPQYYPDGTTFLIGNEIIVGLHNLPPASYAEKYHNCYQLLKGINPTYKLATVASPSYYRYLDYIENFRTAYRQKYGEYPEIGAYRLNVYSGYRHLEDWSKRLREKMKSWGDQNKDLIIAESCVRDGTVEDNINYLTLSLDYVTNRTNRDLGKPSDSYHMVQGFAWFSLNAGVYSGCTLFKPEQHWETYPPLKDRLTPVGEALAAWVQENAPTASPAFCAICPEGNPPKSQGNADCDGQIDLADFNAWLSVYQRKLSGQEVSVDQKAEVDFNCQKTDQEHRVSLADFNVWLSNYKGSN